MSTPPPGEVLTLHNDDLVVRLTPRRGANIDSIRDPRAGVELLFRTPWGWLEPSEIPPGDTQQQWLARYAGGWQLLLPNAGAATNRAGVEQGYHGEAAVIGWRVDDSGSSQVTLSCRLTTAPLTVRRRVELAGATLVITDTVQNESPVPVAACWVSHPAFGAPFVDGDSIISTNARTVVTDRDAPGRLAADRVTAWPSSVLPDGQPVDLRFVPAPGSGRAAFAALTDFPDRAWYAISSASAGGGIAVGWDTATHPFAWWWQEAHASPGHPWFGRAYAIAIEPANVLPGEGAVGRWRRSTPLPIGPESTLTNAITLTRYTDSGPVSDVDAQGRVSHGPVEGTTP